MLKIGVAKFVSDAPNTTFVAMENWLLSTKCKSFYRRRIMQMVPTSVCIPILMDVLKWERFENFTWKVVFDSYKRGEVL